MISSIEIVPCEWNRWCAKECTDRRIMRIKGKDGFGTYIIERPIEENLNTCLYCTLHYDEMDVKKHLRKEKKDGQEQQ